MEAYYIPDHVKKNIENWFGPAGKAWLDTVPVKIEKAKATWQLKDIVTEAGGSSSILLRCRTSGGRQAMLKLAFSRTQTEREVRALEAYGGRHSPNLYGFDDDSGAMLMERLRPGLTGEIVLATRERVKPVIEILASLRINDSGLNKNIISELNSTADEALLPLSDVELEFVAATRMQLRTTMPHLIMVNADPNLSNLVFSSIKGWCIVDPNPVLGEAAYEVAFFLVRGVSTEWRSKIWTWCKELSAFSHCSPTRVLAWGLVRAIRNAAWAQAVGDDRYLHISINRLRALIELTLLVDAANLAET